MQKHNLMRSQAERLELQANNTRCSPPDIKRTVIKITQTQAMYLDQFK